MATRLIFSDLHFGDAMCSLRLKEVAEGLRNFLRELGYVDEIILAGDILDANISTLTTAIEGVENGTEWPKLMGCRKWLEFIFEDDKFRAGKIIHIPGNHDYIIWNLLSTDKVFMKPLSQGEILKNLPLMADEFPEPFIKGIAPENMRKNFIVIYPDYEFSLAGRKTIVTHGHYLDEKQSWFNSLEELIKEEGDKEEAVRKFFIITAQYQAIANAVSYLKGTRTLVDKLHKDISKFLDSINIIGKLRGQSVDAGMREAIEMYLKFFRDKQVDIFIFGHTHEIAHSYTDKILFQNQIEIWNSGCFLRKENRAGSFILTNDEPKAGGVVKLFEVDYNGEPNEKYL